MASIEELLGRVCAMSVVRIEAPGAFLAPVGESPDSRFVVLLPRGELPEGLAPGAPLDVFVYLDSEDRPTATLRTPRVGLGEVAFLEVKDVGQFGAFVDWGLRKELLVPFAEQTREAKVGDRHPIGLYIDASHRLAGTMRVSEMLEDVKGGFEQDEWVEGEAWRNDPEIGVFVILEKKYVALVPAHESHNLVRGQAARFRVTNILPDGRVELSLRGHAHEELEGDASAILALLSREGAPKVGDRSNPEELRALFGLSKKAFKRAVGRLLATGAVIADAAGFLVPTGAAPAPPVKKRPPSTPPRT